MLRLDLDEFIFLRLTLLALLIVGIALYLITARRYQSSNSVASSYDQWTEDGILSFTGRTYPLGSLWFAAATERFSDG